MPLQALALLLSGVGAQLVGPGGVVPYGGGGGGPRRVGTVRDWAQGFFVAGSTLDDLNGVYALVDPNTLRRACRTRRCKVAYRNEESDWILAFAGPPVGLKTKSGKETEWVFVDQSGKDRFEHAGDTVIPGAGDSWSHSHRPSPYERTAAEDMATGDDDNVDELPWQVIYIGDRNMVWNLVNQRRHHNAVIRNAIAGNLVSEFGSLQALAAPDGATAQDKREPLAPPADLVAKADASEAAQFAASGAVPALKPLASRRWRQPPTPSSTRPHQSARRQLRQVRGRVEGGQVRDPALLEPGRGRGSRKVGVGPGFIKAGRVLSKITALRRGADFAE